MGNHYHLAVETPQGNLASGMQWLQSTFANRFNAYRGERGHLFQGRYKALVVEDGEALGQVCHYIHLNPVRAAIVSAEQLGEYRHSSYWYLSQPKQRPACLQVEAALVSAGELPDSRAGWASYGRYLAWQAAEGPAGKNAAYVCLARGWAIGGAGFKKALLQDHAIAAQARAWESEGFREVRAARWRQALEAAVARLPAAAKSHGSKSAAWKIAVATHLKETTDVSNSWLAEQLSMGSPFYVSKHVGLHRRLPSADVQRLLLDLRKVRGKR